MTARYASRVGWGIGCGRAGHVFGNIRHNKRLTRLNHRGRDKVNTQWNLYCMVHNIEKLAKTNLGRPRIQ